MFEKMVVVAFRVFFKPFVVTFILPFFVVGDAGRIGVEAHTFIAFDIEAEEVMVAEAAFFAGQPARFLDALGHDEIGVPDTGRLDGIVHGLEFYPVGLLGLGLAQAAE